MIAEKLNALVAPSPIRDAAHAAFNALDDGANKPTTVHVSSQPGELLSILVTQKPEVQ